MGLKDKIKMIKKLVRANYPAIYSQVNKSIKKYQGACKFRNQLAHCLITWHDPTLMSFQIWDIEIDNEGIHIIAPVVFTINEARGKIEKLKETCLGIIQATMPIQNDFDSRFPNFPQQEF
jgi:hypothetical protein